MAPSIIRGAGSGPSNCYTISIAVLSCFGYKGLQGADKEIDGQLGIQKDSAINNSVFADANEQPAGDAQRQTPTLVE